LWLLSLPKLFLTTKGKAFSGLPPWSPGSAAPDGPSQKWRLKQRRHSVTAFSESFATRAPAPLSSRSTFLLVFLLHLIYVKKPFLLSFTLVVRLNSKLALAFLVTSLHTLTTPLSFSQVACPLFPILYTSFFWVYSWSPCSSMQASCLARLLAQTHWLWAGKMRYLNTDLLSWFPLPSRVWSHEILPSRFL